MSFQRMVPFQWRHSSPETRDNVLSTDGTLSMDTTPFYDLKKPLRSKNSSSNFPAKTNLKKFLYFLFYVHLSKKGIFFSFLPNVYLFFFKSVTHQKHNLFLLPLQFCNLDHSCDILSNYLIYSVTTAGRVKRSLSSHCWYFWFIFEFWFISGWAISKVDRSRVWKILLKWTVILVCLGSGNERN